MKKKHLSKVCALVCMLGFSSVANGATPAYVNSPGAFADVPTGHWSYSAVNKLAVEGIVDGDGKGNFAGNRTLTRYEMAQIVAKAMVRSDKANTETKELIEKLANEYNTELVNLGARVAKTEEAIERFTFHGDLRARYRNLQYDRGSDDGDKDIRFRLFPNIKVNGKWSIGGEIAAAENWRSSNDENDMNSLKLKQIYAQGPLGETGANLTLGKFVYWAGGGPGERTWSPMGNTLNLGMNAVLVTGAKFSFGKELKTDVLYGRANTKYPLYVDYNYVNPGDAGFNGEDITVYGLATRWAPTSKLDFQVNYHGFKANSDVFGNAFNAANDELRLAEVGGMYQFAKDWRLTALAVRSDADEQNNAYKAELRYKQADLAKAGTWALFGTYINVEADSIWRSDDPGTAIWVRPSMLKNAAGSNLGVKGWSFETAYVPSPGTLLRAAYGQYKATTGTAIQGDTDMFQVQYEMFF
jgi:hypothetical protein